VPAKAIREIIDEELAVEVIHFVLNAHGEHAVGLDLERPTVGIERAHSDGSGTIDIIVELRHGKAAFLGVSLAVGPHDFRVDQAVRLLAVDAHVADKETSMDVDLSRGQADARGGVHRLEHVRDELLELGIEFCDRFRANSQARIRILQYWEACHCGSALVSCITR
jgi:hypothetical protein